MFFNKLTTLILKEILWDIYYYLSHFMKDKIKA